APVMAQQRLDQEKSLVRSGASATPAPPHFAYLGGMKRILAFAASLALAGCAAERLAPGPGPSTPHFVDRGHWMAGDGYVLGMSEWQAENAHTVIVALHGMNDYGRFIDAAAKYWQARGISTYAYDQRGFGRTEGNGRWPGHDVM